MSKYDLVVFDFDGTLAMHPDGVVIWDRLVDEFGPGRKCNRMLMDMYLHGDITYHRWASILINIWRDYGVTIDDVEELCDEFRLRSGVVDVMDELMANDVDCMIVSGTIDVLVDSLLTQGTNLTTYCNRLEFDRRGVINGCKTTPYDFDCKRQALPPGINPDRIAFIGDGDNDVTIARVVGYAVATDNASDAMIDAADAIMSGPDLRAILPNLL